MPHRLFLPTLVELMGAGMSVRQIVAELIARGVSTPQGGRWHPQTVARVMVTDALSTVNAVAL
jgi:hypothetical protein